MSPSKNTFNCPACGGEVHFKSVASVFSVCPYCQMMLVRKDLDLETYGKMAVLPADMSPFQLGTSGKFEKRSFTLVGRLRLKWADGFWNEWYAIFDDGTPSWLAEAQGFYMLSFEKPQDLPHRTQISVGKPVALSGGTYEVDDIKEATCVGSEGELPFRSPKGRTSVSVDLTGKNQTFACIDYSEDGTRCYEGRYVEFDDLHFTGLRELDGW